MTIESLNKRLTRLGDSASPMANLADSLDMATARHRARQDEWQAAGNTGRMPPEPLESPPRQERPPAGQRDVAHDCRGPCPRHLPAGRGI